MSEIRGDSTLVATRRQVSADLGDELAILAMDAGRYYGVESVGRRVWELVQTPTTLSAVVATLLDEYEVEEPTLLADVAKFMSSLADEGLLEVSPPGPTGA